MNNDNQYYQLPRPSRNVQKWVKMLTHFLCLGIIFILPEVLMTKSGVSGPGAWRMYMKALVYVGVFYLNYYIILDQCIGRRYWLLRLVGWNIIVIAAAMCITILILTPPDEGRPLRKPRHEDMPLISMQLRKASFMLRDVVMIILTIALSLAVKLSDYWVKLSHKHHRMEAAQRQEELESLRHQLNPHFLFNTLNSIYALIAMSPEKAQKAVHELSQLLRYVLYENTASVPLSEELSFIDNYVKLMRLRIGDKFPINVVLEANGHEHSRVAPLLFISPVENAFKYGNTGRPDAFIDINIRCDEGTINCTISNRFLNDDNIKTNASGIGHKNLRRRLDLIYGRQAEVTTSTEGDIYTFNLKLKLSSI